MFVALRFLLDRNLAGRTYWYRSEIPLEVGDEALAPVGVHDRLQLGKVERTGRTPPRDLGLLKSVEAKCGARTLRAGDAKCTELGGVRYDEKHFTFFRRVLVTESDSFLREELEAYGVKKFAPMSPKSMEEIAFCPHCILVYGEGAEALGAKIIALLRGEAKGEEELVSALRKKFSI